VTPERTALKEWAVLVDAFVRGEICTMIRKGGIREQRAGFSVRHDQFLLYPTFFHENPDDLAERFRKRLPLSHAWRPEAGTVVLTHLARVRAHWHVTDLDKLRIIDGEHGLSWKAVEERFHYRNKPGVHVIALDVLALPDPVCLPEARRYAGCVSWVELDHDVDVSRARELEGNRTVESLDRLRESLGSPAISEFA
jgi:hypothetical protein